ETTHQRVALSLELLEAQQARAAEGIARGGGSGDVGKPLRQDRRQLALEPRDLRTQRAPRRAFTGLAVADRDAFDHWLLALAHPRTPCERRKGDSTSAPPARAAPARGGGVDARTQRQGRSSAEQQLHSASSMYSAGTPATRTANSVTRRVPPAGLCPGASS